jgi:putative membrane protein insertion efficiency factor
MQTDQSNSKQEIHHHPSPSLKDLPFKWRIAPRYVVLALIWFYQLTFSKAIPSDTCRYYPTCSHYTYQAIYRYGLLRGGWMGTKRIISCNPFNPGGYDPVPDLES